jgi:DNA-binding CsgD family transcriptional regulator/tetratricopeptide (TPR) repeat protein
VLPISAGAAPCQTPSVRRPILERERELAELGTAARQAKDGEGSVVLVVGEAGIGKSSLVEAIRSVLPAEGRLLIGYCDDLATPRVLGPLRDLIGSVGTALTNALAAADRGQVLDALPAELNWPEHPTVLVIEDVHWADDATLDVLRFLVRRIARLPVVLVLTYRDDELTGDHPLRQFLGLVSSTPRLRRLPLARLSADAVRRLGAGTSLDTGRLFTVTSGNPFFVTEVLASGDLGAVPPTVAEAVRSRLRQLDAPVRDALELLAVVPRAVERWLVEAVVPGGLRALAAAEQRGVLTVSPTRIAFRHELMRRAIVDSLPAVRRVTCNQLVLSALLDRPGVDLSRIVHHAALAGDDEVVIRHGPAAAREAAVAGSHRAAVAHYRLVLAHPTAYPAAERAELLTGYSIECYTIGLAELAVRAQQEAVRLRRDLGDPRALGEALRWLSRAQWWAGDRGAAEACATEAIEILDRVDDRGALAWALSNRSQLYMLSGRRHDCVTIGRRAVDLARQSGDPATLSHALQNVGLARFQLHQPDGRAMLDESLAVALAAGEVEHACRAYANLVWELILDLDLGQAEQVLEPAIELANGAEFLGFLRYLHVEQSMIHLARSAWDEAEREANWAVEAQLHMRCPALIVLGLVRVRRGRPGGDDLLAEAWQIAQRLGEPLRIGPALTALAEAAWLRGDTATVRSLVVPHYEEIRRFGDPFYAAAFGYWMRVADAPAAAPDDPGHPYALQAAGQWRAAARIWRRSGFEYAAAAALSQSDDPDDLLDALATLDPLGAEPLARRVRQRLKEQGVSRIPRGPTPSTRDNPAGLTGRQVEVVRLVADGLSNAEIAARLVLSVRTVDSHVAAVLDKLSASTRRDAVARARALGLIAGR